MIARVPFLLVLDKLEKLTKHEVVAAVAISRPDEVRFTVEQVSLRTMVKSVLSLRYQYGFTLESGLEERQARTCTSEIAFFFVEPQKMCIFGQAPIPRMCALPPYVCAVKTRGFIQFCLHIFRSSDHTTLTLLNQAWLSEAEGSFGEKSNWVQKIAPTPKSVVVMDAGEVAIKDE